MDKTNFSARRRVWGAVMRCLMVLCAALTCALAVFLIIYVLAKGIPHLSWELLSTKPSYLEGTIGILPDIISTVCMVLTTLVVVLPVGVCAAVYLTEYARNRRLAAAIEYTAETRESLRYPVGVAEGARDSATGELIWPADGDFAVEYRDGVAYLTREGGDAWTVKPEDVVYPEV